MSGGSPQVPFDDHLVRMYRQDPEKTLGHLNAAVAVAFEENDPELILTTLAIFAKAFGMTRLAKEAGVQRESLHRMLSRRGNPEWYSLFRVLRALRLRLKVEAASPAAA